MERVAFLIEESSDRLRCLLNPESLVLRRSAGIRARRSVTGSLTGAGLSDDPLLFTGGGRTELDLDLLFDVNLAGSSVRTADVRDLTAPFWRLAENTSQRQGYAHPALVRLIWGKSWNFPGVVIAVAERLEYFTPGGVPQRSWLRMRLLRVAPAPERRTVTIPASSSLRAALPALAIPEASIRVQQIRGGIAPAVPRLSTPSVGIGRAFLTAGGIIADALSSTTAARRLAYAAARLTAIARGIGAALSNWLQSSGESPFLARARQHLGAIAGAVSATVRAAGTALVKTISAATTAVRRAASGMAALLKDAVVDPVAGAAAKIAQKTLVPLLDEMRPVAAAMSLAARVIADAVRARAAIVIPAAAQRIDAAAGKLKATMAEIGDRLRAAAPKVVQTIGSALDDIGAVLARLKTKGETAIRTILPPLLNRLGSAAETLWSLGERAAAATMSLLVGGMALSVRGIAAATEALGSVGGAAGGAAIAAAAATVRGLHLVKGPVSIEQGAALQDAAEQLAAASDIIRPPQAPPAGEVTDPEATPEPAEQVAEAANAKLFAAILQPLGPARTTLQQIADSGRLEDAATLASALSAIDAAAAGVAASDEKRAAAAIVDGVAALPPAPAEEAAPQAAALRIEPAERLDIIAYRQYGSAAAWRVLAVFNDIVHPLRLPAGLVLRIPPLPGLGGAS